MSWIASSPTASAVPGLRHRGVHFELLVISVLVGDVLFELIFVVVRLHVERVDFFFAVFVVLFVAVAVVIVAIVGLVD